MGIYEDVDDLKIQIKRSVNSNNKQQVGELLKQAFALCEKIKEVLKDSDEDERVKLVAAMSDFREFLAAETKNLSKKMGLSEDQFARFNENPENFSKDQWMAIQAIKSRFTAKTKELRQAIRHQSPVKGERLSAKVVLPENWRTLIEENPMITSISPAIPPLPKKKKKLVIKKVKKSKWLKS